MSLQPGSRFTTRSMRDKVIVITGASGGIGAVLAHTVVQGGTNVVLVARREESLRGAARACGERAHPVVADVTRREDVRRVVSESLARFGRIDVWVNNVGQGISRMPSQLTDECVDDIIEVNVNSALCGMQEIFPTSRSAGSA